MMPEEMFGFTPIVSNKHHDLSSVTNAIGILSIEPSIKS